MASPESVDGHFLCLNTQKNFMKDQMRRPVSEMIIAR